MNNKNTTPHRAQRHKKVKTYILLLLIIAMTLTACAPPAYYYVMNEDNVAATFDASAWECKSFILEDGLLIGCVNNKTGENESYLATALVFVD
jgi:hypothetical protein